VAGGHVMAQPKRAPAPLPGGGAGPAGAAGAAGAARRARAQEPALSLEAPALPAPLPPARPLALALRLRRRPGQPAPSHAQSSLEAAPGAALPARRCGRRRSRGVAGARRAAGALGSLCPQAAVLSGNSAGHGGVRSVPRQPVPLAAARAALPAKKQSSKAFGAAHRVLRQPPAACRVLQARDLCWAQSASEEMRVYVAALRLAPLPGVLRLRWVRRVARGCAGVRSARPCL